MANNDIQLLQQSMGDNTYKDKPSIGVASLDTSGLNIGTNPAQQVELTAEKKAQMPVVNMSKNRGLASRIGQFLTNPHIQYFLSELGKAAVEGDKNTFAYQLGSANEQIITNTANNIALSGKLSQNPQYNDFVSPQVRVQMQQQQQQQDEFNKNLDMQMKQLGLKAQTAASDYLLKSAAQNHDWALTQERIKQLKQEQDLAPTLQKSRIAYMNDMGNAAITGSQANMMTAASHYANVLGTQLQFQNNTVKELQKQKPEQGWLEYDSTYQTKLANWQAQMNAASQSLSATQNEYDAIQKVVSSKLGVKSSSGEMAAPPIIVNSFKDIKSVPVNHTYIYLGKTYKKVDAVHSQILPDGDGSVSGGLENPTTQAEVDLIPPGVMFNWKGKKVMKNNKGKIISYDPTKAISNGLTKTVTVGGQTVNLGTNSGGQ